MKQSPEANKATKQAINSGFQEMVLLFNEAKKDETASFTYNDYGIFEKWFFRIVNSKGNQMSLFTICIREVRPERFILEDANDENEHENVADLLRGAMSITKQRIKKL